MPSPKDLGIGGMYYRKNPFLVAVPLRVEFLQNGMDAVGRLFFLRGMKLALFFVLFATSLFADLQVEEGEIEGALYMYAVPEDWNGKLLMVAHGYAPEGSELVAQFNAKSRVYGALIEQGWLVARTSYRRSGIVVDDGILDLDNLLAFIEKMEGSASRKLVVGSSMGGLMVTLMMEDEATDFDGAVGMGAAIYHEREDWNFPLSEKPLKPLLLMSNQSEYDRPERYHSAAEEHGIEIGLWKISRDGHVNVNYAEQLAAIYAVNAWLEGEEVGLVGDATRDVAPSESSAKVVDQGLQVVVESVDAQYGNVVLDLIEEDLDLLGIELGNTFVVSSNGQAVKCLLGTTYGDVAVGEWVLFKLGNGNYKLSRNFKNASDALGIGVGDTVELRMVNSEN